MIFRRWIPSIARIGCRCLRSNTYLLLTAVVVLISYSWYRSGFLRLFNRGYHACLLFLTINSVDSLCHEHPPGGLGRISSILVSHTIITTIATIHLSVGKLNTSGSWVVGVLLLRETVLVRAHGLLSLRTVNSQTLLLLLCVWL